MLIVDFETYSPTAISAGSVKYCRDPEADIICLGYKVDDKPTKIWMPGEEIPKAFFVDQKIVAHNALFDYLVWKHIGPKYNFPEKPLLQWLDTQALANRYSLPGALAKAGAILNLDVQKGARGKALIRKICVPLAGRRRPRFSVDYQLDDLQGLVDYCKQDVDTTYELLSSLPASYLSPQEQNYWLLTQQMNLKGLPIDTVTADKILGYIGSYVTEMTLQVPQITDGEVDRVTQIARLKKWINGQGIPVSDLTAPTVEQLLTRDSLPEKVRAILVLRQTLGRSSTAKYVKIQEMALDDRVFNNLQYYGTSTGRWAGRGFQLQNLPRASVDDPEDYIRRFNDFKAIEDPVNTAKALIRPMIKAPKGKKLIVSDYKSIENRILVWLAEDIEAIKLINRGDDPYVDMAAFLYKKPYDAIVKSERQVGKIIILGCGFGMGVKRFNETAKSWGTDISASESMEAVNAYRTRYRLVVQMWYKFKDCVIAAIQNPGKAYGFNRCTFKVVKARDTWLIIVLPSQRKLFYMEPHLRDDEYGLTPGHFGTNPYTKKWTRLRLIPGRITENIVQATARDIMAQGLQNVSESMPEVELIGTCHDEAIGEINDRHIDHSTQRLFDNWLCDMPEWAAGLPLEAEGYIAKRYRK